MLIQLGLVPVGNLAPLQDSWVEETFWLLHLEAGPVNAAGERRQVQALVVDRAAEDKAADTFLGQEGQGAGV